MTIIWMHICCVGVNSYKYTSLETFTLQQRRLKHGFRAIAKDANYVSDNKDALFCFNFANSARRLSFSSLSARSLLLSALLTLARNSPSASSASFFNKVSRFLRLSAVRANLPISSSTVNLRLPARELLVSKCSVASTIVFSGTTVNFSCTSKTRASLGSSSAFRSSVSAYRSISCSEVSRM